GRVHLIHVPAAKSTAVQLDPLADSALRTDQEMVGFLFASEGERLKREGMAVSELGRALGVEEILLLGIREYEGTPAIVATTYLPLTGRYLVSAAVPIPEAGAPSPAHIRALVAYVTENAPPVDSIRVI